MIRGFPVEVAIFEIFTKVVDNGPLKTLPHPKNAHTPPVGTFNNMLFIKVWYYNIAFFENIRSVSAEMAVVAIILEKGGLRLRFSRAFLLTRISS